MEPTEFSPLDPMYFTSDPWAERVRAWLARALTQGRAFVAADERVIRKVVSDPDSGARVVVNLGPTALRALLNDERYLNLYERPLVGGKSKGPTDDRKEVDGLLGFVGKELYFAALAVGGTGVAYYGEYCAVLKLENVDPAPGLFDRDSYDILYAPFNDRTDRQALIDRVLRGAWDERYDMLVLSVLSGLTSGNRIVTAGMVSQAVLRDQQFVEVHLRPARSDGTCGGFELADIEELRESPDVVTAMAWLRQRAEAAHPLNATEQKVLEEREDVEKLLRTKRVVEEFQGVPRERPVRRRVVTQHDRGYQWA